MAKPTEEHSYGFSEHDGLMEEAASSLMAAYEAKDHSAFMDALESLIHLVKEKSHAPDAQ